MAGFPRMTGLKESYVIEGRFEGRRAIVTGGARGIGLAIAERIAAEGGRVLVADIDQAALDAAVDGIGERALGFPLDVTSEASWADAVTMANERWGGVDILVNNAGIAGRSVPALEISLEEWNQVIAIDLTGVWVGCKAVLPTMVAAGYGRIVNIASIAGKEGNPNASPYSAAKAGVIAVTKSLAKEVATTGVLINCITPAMIETEILKQITQAHIDFMISKIPMGRPGQPEEVAALATFLCSEETSFSTGAAFDLSGGRATY